MTCRFGLGRRINPATGETVDVPEHEHFYTCETCGESVDKRDLEAVFAHEIPDHKRPA